MPRQSVFEMPFTKVCAALVAKAEKKDRTRAEVDGVIRWLTGYVSVDILDGLTYGPFLSLAPAWNPRADLIHGSVCSGGSSMPDTAHRHPQLFYLQFRL